MGVILGTLTTKDGQVIPLPTAKDMVDAVPQDDYRKEEERKYKGCLPKAKTYRAWDVPVPCPHNIIYYGSYRVQTENLKRQGETMTIGIDYNTNQFRMFEYLFKHPKEWMDSTFLGTMTGTPKPSASASLKPIKDFLHAQGLVEEKAKEGTAAGKMVMFIGQCEKPEEEAKLWYAKMLASRRKGKNKMPVAKTQPRAVTAPGGITPVSVDTVTMEAIVRVPLDRLAEVLRVIS